MPSKIDWIMTIHTDFREVINYRSKSANGINIKSLRRSYAIMVLFRITAYDDRFILFIYYYY